MRLEWIRPKAELKQVLMQPQADGPEIAYWLFSDPAKNWHNMTVLAPGTYDVEFNKTFGHYHTPRVLETYKLISGEGIFLLQKKHIANKNWTPEFVAEVYMVKPNIGEEIIVPLDFGHSWSNVGDTPLITFDDWHEKHVPLDYEAIKELHGMSFYITKNADGLKFEPNPKYKNHPEPKVVTVKEFMQLYPN